MNQSYLVIPDPVLTDIKISMPAKIMFGYIALLTKQRGFCWADNDYFAEKLQCNIRTVQRFIKDLGDAGYILVQSKRDGRRIYISKAIEWPSSFAKKVGAEPTTRERKSPSIGDNFARSNDVPVVSHNNMSNTIKGNSIKTDPPPQGSISTVGKIPPWWEAEKASFLNNSLLAERFHMAKRISPAAAAAARAYFVQELELRCDWKEATFIQQHFMAWYAKGIREGWILQDGTVKDNITPENNGSAGSRQNQRQEEQTRAYFDELAQRFPEAFSERQGDRGGDSGDSDA